MNEEAHKTFIVFASEHCRFNETLFSAAQSTLFIWKKQYRHTSHIQSYAQVTQTSAAKKI